MNLYEVRLTAKVFVEMTLEIEAENEEQAAEEAIKEAEIGNTTMARRSWNAENWHLYDEFYTEDIAVEDVDDISDSNEETNLKD